MSTIMSLILQIETLVDFIPGLQASDILLVWS